MSVFKIYFSSPRTLCYNLPEYYSREKFKTSMTSVPLIKKMTKKVDFPKAAQLSKSVYKLDIARS